MGMTPVEPGPSTLDPENFATRADQLLGTVLPLFVTEANALEANVVEKEASAVAAKTAAEQARDTAQGHAGTATTQAGIATTKAGEAGGSADAAAGAAGVAVAAAEQAGNDAIAAGQSEALAGDWAEKLDGPVAGGGYSAKYWSQQAQATVTGNLVYRGAWSAAGGIYPPAPSTGDFYKVSVGGMVDGITYAANDDIIYNGSSWDKIDNQQPSQRGLIYYLGGQ